MSTVGRTFQAQINGYYCGPAATRVALTAVPGIAIPSQLQLAAALGTDEGGTDSINDVTRVLNAYLGAGTYTSVILPATLTEQHITDMAERIRTTVDSGRAVVCNVGGTIVDTAGRAYSYGGHYVTVTGYDGDKVLVSDVAIREYWATIRALAWWCAAGGYRGYTYLTHPTGTTQPPTKGVDMFRLIEKKGAKQRVLMANALSRTGFAWVDYENEVQPQIRILTDSGAIPTVDARTAPNATDAWVAESFGPSHAEVRRQYLEDQAAAVVARLPAGAVDVKALAAEIVKLAPAAPSAHDIAVAVIDEQRARLAE